VPVPFVFPQLGQDLPQQALVLLQSAPGFLDHVPFALGRPVAAAGQDGDQGIGEALGR
jgi:hypothetical protein